MANKLRSFYLEKNGDGGSFKDPKELENREIHIRIFPVDLKS